LGLLSLVILVYHQRRVLYCQLSLIEVIVGALVTPGPLDKSSSTSVFRLKRKGHALSTYNTAYTTHHSAPRALPHFAFTTLRQNVVYAGTVIRNGVP